MPNYITNSKVVKQKNNKYNFDILQTNYILKGSLVLKANIISCNVNNSSWILCTTAIPPKKPIKISKLVVNIVLVVGILCVSNITVEIS